MRFPSAVTWAGPTAIRLGRRGNRLTDDGHSDRALRPKAVGKSWVAEVLRTHLGVAHVDADELVGDLLTAGTPPAVDGWLTWVRRRVVDALARHALVTVEATGAWDSDWRLADDLEVAGARVLRDTLASVETDTRRG